MVVRVCYLIFGVVERFFRLDIMLVLIYDWVGLLDSILEYFVLFNYNYDLMFIECIGIIVIYSLIVLNMRESDFILLFGNDVNFRGFGSIIDDLDSIVFFSFFLFYEYVYLFS